MMLLPYPEKPNFICCHNKVFLFGIIQANSLEDITKWLCAKCINTVYNPNSPKNKFDLAICINVNIKMYKRGCGYFFGPRTLYLALVCIAAGLNYKLQDNNAHFLSNKYVQI